MEDDLILPEDEQTQAEIDRLLGGPASPDEAEPIREPRKSPKLPNLSKVPTGKIVAAIMDESGTQMSDEERKVIEEISDEDGMAAFLEANLGTEPIVDEMKARSLFGTYMMQKMDIRAIGNATRFYNLRSTQECIEFAKGLCEKEDATIEEKTNAGKLWLTANREFSVMLKRFVDMAQEMAPQGKPPTGKNQAPNIFADNVNVLVQGQPSG